MGSNYEGNGSLEKLKNNEIYSKHPILYTKNTRVNEVNIM